jgi:rod shape-determining protein MreC
MLLSLGLMVVDHQHQEYIAGARSYLSLVAVPFQYVIDFPIKTVSDLSLHFKTRHKLQKENTVLKTERLDLALRLQKLESLESENSRLRELLQSSSQMGQKALVAELLRVDSDPFSQRVVLNKGTRNGVYLGQPVLDSQGIMGQIVRVGPLTSVALLITDTNHSVPVQDNRSGVRGIASGTGIHGKLELNFITDTADIEPGDLMVTSGLGQRFPAGYPVGIVESVEKQPGESFAKIVIKPSAQLDRSREVLLVWQDELSTQQHELEQESDQALNSTPTSNHATAKKDNKNAGA